MKTEVEAVNLSDLGSWFGRMYPELSAQIKGPISEQSFKKRSASYAKTPPLIPMPDKGWPTAGFLVDVEGHWSIAWRVFDAQFWGVPQRRRRIALIADFGGPTAAEVLFERESVSGYSPKSGETRETTTGNPQKGVGTSEHGALTNCIQGDYIDSADSAGCNGKGWAQDVSCTLNTIDRPAVYDARGNGGGTVAPTMTGDHNDRITDYTAIIVRGGGGTVAGFRARVSSKAGIGFENEISPTILAGNNSAAVLVPPSFSQSAYDKYVEDDKTATLKARGGSYGGGGVKH